MTSRLSIAVGLYPPRDGPGSLEPPAATIAPLAPPSTTQLVWRGRIESVLRIAAPVLDLVLVAGDRVSRLVDREPPAPSPAARPMGPLPAQRRVGPGPAEPGRE
jgi:hypothetical protein